MPPQKGQQRAARRIKTRVIHLKIDDRKIDLDLSHLCLSLSIYLYLCLSIYTYIYMSFFTPGPEAWSGTVCSYYRNQGLNLGARTVGIGGVSAVMLKDCHWPSACWVYFVPARFVPKWQWYFIVSSRLFTSRMYDLYAEVRGEMTGFKNLCSFFCCFLLSNNVVLTNNKDWYDNTSCVLMLAANSTDPQQRFRKVDCTQRKFVTVWASFMDASSSTEKTAAIL